MSGRLACAELRDGHKENELCDHVLEIHMLWAMHAHHFVEVIRSHDSFCWVTFNTLRGNYASIGNAAGLHVMRVRDAALSACMYATWALC